MTDANNGWFCFFNEEHQIPYYHNPTTGESQWEPPEGFVEADPGGAVGAEGSPLDSQPPTCSCLLDDESYELDTRLCFLDEMARMGFMQAPADEEALFVLRGGVSPPLRRKIEALDTALQMSGSDEEWAAVFQADGMALLRYLTCFLNPRLVRLSL
jgi:hypothetical protein